MFKDIFKYTPTKEENLISNIIMSIIDEPNTDRILANNGKCYLSNTEKGIQVCFSGTLVIIVKDNACFEYCCNGNFEDYLEKLINSKIDNRVSKIEEIVRNTKCSILEKLK